VLRQGRKAVRPLIVALTAFVAILPTTIASAGNDLGHKAGSNATVTYNSSLLGTNAHDALHYNDNNSIEPTDISTLHYHETAGLEVNVYDYSYGNTGWYGRWYCRRWSGSICLEGVVQINLSYGPYTTTEMRSLMCEEFGHSVGLAHSSESASCMSQRWDRTLLTSHDKGILNAKY
jgi:hypothetical protein